MTAAGVHETAIVETGAVLGEGTRVWHHAHVRAGAILGAGCVVGKNVYIGEGVRIGAGSKIQNNVSVFEGVELEGEVFVGPSAVFTNDRFPRAQPESGWEVIATRVRRGASIGANATIICGVELGSWCTVAAGAVVTRDVKPHQVVAGNPAYHFGWVCRCGFIVERKIARAPAGKICDRCGRVFPEVEVT